jgi:hypothetical protein
MTTWRQFNLFKGPRQHGDLPPSPKEFNIHVAIVKALKVSISKQWIYFHVPNGEKRDPVTAARLKAMGTMPGMPDLMFIGPGPAVFCLELKRDNNRMSEAQVAMHAHLMACGCEYLCTNSYDEALATLKSLGIVRATVSA